MRRKRKRFSISVKNEKEERRKKKRREKDKIRNKGQNERERKKEEERRRRNKDRFKNKSQNEILSSERNVKGKEVSLEVSRVVGQKFRFGVGGRVKGQARLGFGGKQGKMRCRCQVFILKFQINALSEHSKKLT